MVDSPSSANAPANAVLLIEPEGALRAEPAAGFSDRLGRWRVAPSPASLMLLVREDIAEAERITLCGEVQPRSGIVEVLSFAASAAWRGELRLLDPAHRRSIYLDGGFVRGAFSDDPTDRLGEILFRRGVVTTEQLDRAVHDGSGRRIGEALVAQGACTTQDLFGYLTEQVREIVFGTLLARRGYFFFLADFDAATVPAHVHLSAQELLMEGIRRADEMTFFREKIPSNTVVPAPRVPRPNAKLEAREQQVLALCDGARDLEAIARKSGLGEFDATKTLFHLLQGGFVEIGARAPRDEDAALKIYGDLVGSFNDILGEIHRTVDKAGRAPQTRDLLVQYLGAGGIAETVLEGLAPDKHGHLSAERIVANLTRLPVASRGQALSYALNEYVCFALFAAGAVLRRDDEHRLLSRVNQLLREVHA